MSENDRQELVEYPREVRDACPFCARRRAVEFTPSEFDHAVMQFEPLNPVTPGHMLFVPSDHVEHRNGDYYTDAHARRAMWAAHAYAIGRDEDFNLITSSGSAATQTVAHVHIHYVPRRAGDGMHLPWTGQVSS
nr:MAG TPA: hypothetical protein [Caudoviricetes sp.]